MARNSNNLPDNDNPWEVLARDIANQTWLIGLGVVSKAQEESGKLLESLLNEGKALEARLTKVIEKGAAATQGTYKIAETVQFRTAATSEDMENIFEARVVKALERLQVPSRDDLNAVSKQLEALRRTVEMLRKDRQG
jgi:poly(hydroxyalkanoate) granule-associated protein